MAKIIWHVEPSTGPAALFHNRTMPEPLVPTVWVHRLERRALVLGSTQDEGIVDSEAARAAGIEVCRRRSGGGLVGLDPENDLWIDVLIPAGSRLWNDDVGKAFGWLGQVWAATLRDTLGLGQVAAENNPVTVHSGPVANRQAGRLLCFAGLGPGEVTVARHKVVGISQRRTRTGARFQCAMTWRWEPADLRRFVKPKALREAGIELDALHIGLPVGLASPSRRSVVESFLENLPRP